MNWVLCSVNGLAIGFPKIPAPQEDSGRAGWPISPPWILRITKVADAGLAHLAGLTKLSRLSLHGTQVSVQGSNSFNTPCQT